MAIRVVTLCSGYDSQGLSLERLKRDYSGFDYELVAWAEFDPDSKQPIEKQPAVIAHNALFPEWSDRNLGDITNADWGIIKGDIDLLCYSTPCQSISSAGLQHGFREGSGTRSSIIWSVLDAVRVLRPKYLLLENVPAMVSKKFISDFNAWQSAISSLGYDNYTEILNAKDYNIPQNRSRLFMVSVRKDLGERYYFPRGFTLERRLKDVLEPQVDEKYYLGDKMIKAFLENSRVNSSQDGIVSSPFGISPTLTAGHGNCPKVIEPFAVAVRGRNPDNPSERGKSNGRYKQRLEPNFTGCANTITSVQKDCYIAEPMISIHPLSHRLEFNLNSSIKDIAPTLRATDYKCPPVVWEPRVMQVGNIWPDTEKFKNRTMGRVYNPDGISPTINCCGGGDREPKIVEGEMISDNLLDLVQAGLVRIRKLTPRECFRLQGLEDCDIDKIQSTGISNNQQYKLAGNSIAIPCLYHLFRKLFVDTGNEKEQMTLF